MHRARLKIDTNQYNKGHKLKLQHKSRTKRVPSNGGAHHEGAKEQMAVLC